MIKSIHGTRMMRICGNPSLLYKQIKISQKRQHKVVCYSTDSSPANTIHLWGSFCTIRDKTRGPDERVFPKVTKYANSIIDDTICSLSVGSAHMAAVTTKGDLYTTGENILGQCGQIPQKDLINEFARVDRFAIDQEYAEMKLDKVMLPGHDQDAEHIKFDSVVCGKDFTMAITRDRTNIYACGCNDSGQLGLGYSKNRFKLYRLPLYNEKDINDESHTNINKIKQLACGAQHAIILFENGDLSAFGSNGFGQLANENSFNQVKPKKVNSFTESGETVEEVQCGLGHSLFRTSTGRLFAVGRGYEGQLGVDIKQAVTPIPVDSINSKGRVTHISCGFCHSLAVVDEGDSIGVYIWGSGVQEGAVAWGGGHATVGTHNKRGDEFEAKLFLRLEKESLSSLNVSSGAYHSILHTTNDGLFTAGHGSDGQIGNGKRRSETHGFINITEQFEKSGISHKSIQVVRGGFACSVALTQNQ